MKPKSQVWSSGSFLTEGTWNINDLDLNLQENKKTKVYLPQKRHAISYNKDYQGELHDEIFANFVYVQSNWKRKTALRQALVDQENVKMATAHKKEGTHENILNFLWDLCTFP